jgi:hypothetical protein
MRHLHAYKLEAIYKMTLKYFLVNIHINNQPTLYKVNSVVPSGNAPTRVSPSLILSPKKFTAENNTHNLPCSVPSNLRKQVRPMPWWLADKDASNSYQMHGNVLGLQSAIFYRCRRFESPCNVGDRDRDPSMNPSQVPPAVSSSKASLCYRLLHTSCYSFVGSVFLFFGEANEREIHHKKKKTKPLLGQGP